MFEALTELEALYRKENITSVTRVYTKVPSMRTLKNAENYSQRHDR